MSQRVIKFRAWDVDEKCWIPQQLLAVSAVGGNQGEVLTYDEVEDKWCGEVIPVKLMQFTGLCDKNGKEIYEGDIIRYEWDAEDGPITDILAVEWVEECAGFVVPGLSEEIEVIGNIYENPELLEVLS